MEKTKKNKDWVLISFIWVTFLLHISYMWYTGIKDGSGAGEAPRSVLFPLYSCNLTMYLLLLLLFVPRGKIWDMIAVACAYAGVLGGAVSVAEYLMTPNWQSYEFIKSLLSHATLFISSLWLFIKRYAKISIKNFLPCLYYVALCLADGLLLMWVLPKANPMWLRKPVLDGVNFLSGWNMAWIFLLAVGAFGLVWDLIKYRGKIKF
jgi:hypothetical protein